ncbi:protein kinase [Sorangium cellulosum]|uniref:Protein kinase n=1 Tax=Sorangium cellulosum TaxID=56 RepID=A0A2L0EY16_SORCE|nr:serine/threonine-protein kinase [Sorangium cellulosum]AUX44183.1 protein kinase [Sorangium cellulosum]
MREGTLVAGRFEVHRLAGAGGMGVVYRATDQLTGRPVALKVAPPELAARFRRESRLLEAMQHPLIVQHIAHGANDDGALWLAMEWLEGVTLDARLAQGALPVADALLVAHQIAEALAAVHALGIAHRDLKPSNVLLRDGRVDGVVLLDFGIARAASPSRSTTFVTEASSLVGSLGYVAPEQARGDADVDARADVFALGVLLFECVAGQRPFAADDPLAEMCRILLEEPPRLSDRRPEVPPSVDELVARLLAKDPAGRPADGRAASAAVAEARALLARSPGEGPGGGPASVTDDERRLLSVVLVGAAAPAAGGPPPDDRGARGTRGNGSHGGARGNGSGGGDGGARGSGSGGGDRAGASVEQEPESARDAADEVVAGLASAFGGERVRLPGGTRMVVLSSQTEEALSGRSGAGTMYAFDLAARAAQCALALKAALPARPVALATGRAQLRGRLPAGDVIDRAVARLREAQGAVRVDEVTAGLIAPRFEVEGGGRSFALKGERDTAEPDRTLLGRVTAFVGRDREIAMLRGLFEQSAEEPVARAALVLGEAGIGKSRLRSELVRAVRAADARASVYVARGDPVAAGAPFGMVGELVLAAAGCAPGEPIEARRRKIREHVARSVPEADARRVAGFLGEIAGTPFDDDPGPELHAAREDTFLMAEQVRRAALDWLAARCEAGPVVVVFEDMHWSDHGSVSVLDEALQVLSDRPLLVLGFARHGAMETFPGLWAQRGVQHIKLGALSPRAAERLVRSALGEELDAAEVARLVEHADGHPFFLEELVRVRAEGRGDLPPTVVALMHTRIEALPAEARRTLRAASVFGGSFWPAGVRQLLGGGTSAESLDRWLKSLLTEELVVRRGGSRYPGHDELTFRHALVRDAAYGMLTDGDRAAGHRAAARWLRSVGETDERVLAEHAERGASPREHG